MTISIQPIGTVRSSRSDVRDDGWDSEQAHIELHASFGAEALAGLDTFSHVEVLFYMDRVEPTKIETGARHPRNNRDWPAVGIFAQRGKNRPNQIGTTVCRILRVEGSRLHVEGLDAVDGTPVIDIKPWVREFGPRGALKQPGWMNALMRGYWGLASMNLEVRQETAGDEPAICALNASAFKTDAEARLVDALRASGALTLSLVAVLDGAIVGHIAFSPVTVDAGGHTVQGVGLAPMAVAPSHQRKGIGARLIEEGLGALRARGHAFCVVLGHVDYYPRHGFLPARPRGMRWEQGHDGAFFVQALAPGGLDGVSGVVRYRPEFDAL